METSSHGVAARTLACIADVLGAMADGKGGLRSGPAGNKRWSHSFALLEVLHPLSEVTVTTFIPRV